MLTLQKTLWKAKLGLEFCLLFYLRIEFFSYEDWLRSKLEISHQGIINIVIPAITACTFNLVFYNFNVSALSE